MLDDQFVHKKMDVLEKRFQIDREKKERVVGYSFVLLC